MIQMATDFETFFLTEKLKLYAKFTKCNFLYLFGVVNYYDVVKCQFYLKQTHRNQWNLLRFLLLATGTLEVVLRLDLPS